MPSSKQRSFKMHQKLLYDVIQRQAGTLSKSILEAVMNSVDAKATQCELALTSDTLVAVDDGRGFQSLEEIDKHFDTFGQPHEESEQKIYGAFRMGRGQLFAFGENEWSSGKFRMNVDFKGNADGYSLSTAKEKVPGCEIVVHLYHPLSPSELAETIRETSVYCEWIPIPVFLNDELISKDATAQDWDYESETCYVRLRQSGPLRVYNLGALVCEYPEHQFGRGGVVVSKQQLKLNFARNQVLVRECPVWKEVSSFVKSNADREIRKKPRLNEAERLRLCRQMIYEKEIQAKDARNLKLFTDVAGRHWSINQLEKVMSQFPKCVVHFEDRRGYRDWYEHKKMALRVDSIHQTRLAFVFRGETLQRFEKETLQELFELLASLELSSKLVKWGTADLADVQKNLSGAYRVLTPEELRSTENVWLSLLKDQSNLFPTTIQMISGSLPKKRSIQIGISDTADGWTDGNSYIAISRRFLEGRSVSSVQAMVAVAQLLLHEWCHDGPDTETHDHTTEFYQLYHDCHEVIGLFTDQALYFLPELLRREGKKLSKQSLRSNDRLHRIKLAEQKNLGGADADEP